MIAPACAPNNVETGRAGLEEAQRQTAAMLSAIYAPDDWLCLHAMYGNGGPRRWLTLADDELEAAVAWLWQLNTRLHGKCQAFYGANPRRGNGHDKAEGTSHARSYFADWDGLNPDAALELIRAAGMVAPTVLMSSGRGTHGHWALLDAEHDAVTWTHRQKWIAAALRSDPAVSDWPRKMRLPAFFNVKEKYGPDFPLAHLVAVDPSRRYSWKDIQPRHTPEPLQRPEPTPEQLAAVAALPPGSMSGLSRRFIEEGFTLPGGRHLTGFTVACDLAGRGWQAEQAIPVIRKAMSRWLNRGPRPFSQHDIDDVPRQVLQAFGKPRQPIIDDAGPPPLRAEHDQQDDVEIVPLGEYRERIASAVAVAVETVGVHLNTAGTGCGKTHAAAKRVARLSRSVTSCPTHALCEERAEELRSFGANAAAYPPLDASTCENYGEASKVQAAGLSPGRVVCPTCPFHDACAVSGYLAAVKRADNAPHKVVTHSRLARSAKTVCKRARCVVLEEEPTAAVRPSIAARAKELRTVAEFARHVSKQLRHDDDGPEVDLSEVGFDDPEYELPASSDGFAEFAAWAPPAESPAGERASESVRDVVHGPRRRTRALAAKRLHKAAFLRHVADVARYLYVETRAAMRKGAGAHVIELPATVPPPKNVDAVVWPFLYESDEHIPPDAMRLAVAAASGVLQTLVVQIDANERYAKSHPDAKPMLRARAIGLWQTALPYKSVPVIINDGTNDRATVEALVGREVHDITPPGRVPLQHECVQYAFDVTLGTRPQQVANIICGIARKHGNKPRLGLILLKPHRDELFPEVAEEHVPRRRRRKRKRKRGVVFPESIRSRIAWQTHYGSGLDRGSNEMHEQVDLAVIVGTFRPPSHEIRRRLIEMGLVAEANTGDRWGVIERHARQPDGTPVVYRGLGYASDAWRRAAESITRASARQAPGRARANTAKGKPAVIVTTEATGLPVLPESALPRSHVGIERIVMAVESAAHIRTARAAASCAKSAIDIKAEMAQDDGGDLLELYATHSEISARFPTVPRRTLQRWIARAIKAGAIVRKGQTSAARYSLPAPPRQPEPRTTAAGSCPACGSREHHEHLSADGQMGRRLCGECGAFLAQTVWHGKRVLPPTSQLSARLLDVSGTVQERGPTMPADTTTTDKPMTREQAAAYLGVSAITLASWASRGKGPAFIRTGDVRGRVMYRPCDLATWLESRSIEPGRPTTAT